jgi:hypothetical protein
MGPTPPVEAENALPAPAAGERSVLLARLSRNHAWRALEQLEAREAVGDWLDVVEGGELRRVLETELERDADFRALRALDAPEPLPEPTPTSPATSDQTAEAAPFKTRVRLKIRNVVPLASPDKAAPPPTAPEVPATVYAADAGAPAHEEMDAEPGPAPNADLSPDASDGSATAEPPTTGPAEEQKKATTVDPVVVATSEAATPASVADGLL